MKKTLFVALAALACMSCSQPELRHPKWAYDATIYELNTRQLTEEGTFRAAEAVLPELKQNGIDIIWVMPCQPIGKITRKAAREKFALSDDRLFLLSFGGSLGAENLNDAALHLMKDYVSEHREVLHVHASGKRDFEIT